MNDSKFPGDEKNVRKMQSKNLIEAQAKDIIHGKDSPPEEILALAKNLKKYKSFSYARRILEHAAENDVINQDKNLKLTILILASYSGISRAFGASRKLAVKWQDESDNFACRSVRH